MLKKKAEEYKTRFGVDIIPADGTTDELNSSYLPEADIIFCAARAGTQVINKDQLKLAKNVKVLADVNAVPPSGLEGVGLKDDDEPHECGGFSIGPLTSGDIKVKTQYQMFEKMCEDQVLLLNLNLLLLDYILVVCNLFVKYHQELFHLSHLPLKLVLRGLTNLFDTN